MTSQVQEEMTALIWAAAKGKAGCMGLLLDAGADTENPDEVRGRLPFHSRNCKHVAVCDRIVEMSSVLWHLHVRGVSIVFACTCILSAFAQFEL